MAYRINLSMLTPLPARNAETTETRETEATSPTERSVSGFVGTAENGGDRDGDSVLTELLSEYQGYRADLIAEGRRLRAGAIRQSVRRIAAATATGYPSGDPQVRVALAAWQAVAGRYAGGPHGDVMPSDAEAELRRAEAHVVEVVKRVCKNRQVAELR